MDDKKEEKGRSWAEENGGTILGMGVFVLLGLLVMFTTFCGQV